MVTKTKLFRHRYKLLPFVLIGGVIGLTILLSLSPHIRSLTSSLSSQTANSSNYVYYASRSGYSSLLIGLSLAVGIGLYFWIDYRQHLNPLRQADPGIKYTFRHHLRIVTLPLLRYKWKPLTYASSLTTLTLLALVFTTLFTGMFTHAYAPNEFVTSWKTDNPGTSTSSQITIPTNPTETYNYAVDWGDTTTSSGVTGDITHTYGSVGTYTVKITGTFPAIHFNNVGDKQKILTVEQWGNNPWSTMDGAFMGASNLTIPATDIPDTSGVTDMNNIFSYASSMNQSLNSWDVSHVTTMVQAFLNASSFNQPLDSWNVSSVTDMHAMFSATNSFNQPLNSWDVSSVTDMSSLFVGSGYNKPLYSWDVSHVTDMQNTFAVGAFNQPLSSWDVSSVTTMHNMFNGTFFRQSLASWDVSHVTDMSGAFNGSGGLGTGNYDAMLRAWSTLSLQSGVTLGASNSHYCLSTAERASIISTFGWTIADSGLDCTAASFITTWKTDNPGISASNQITIPTVSGGYNYDVDWGDSSTSTGQTGNATHTYASPGTYTVKITGLFPRIFFGNIDHLNNCDCQKILSVQQWGSNHWDTMSAAFAGATNLVLNASDIPDLSGVTNTAWMFFNNASLNTNIENWDVSHVTDMMTMFEGTSVFNQPLAAWDVSHVTNMEGMFDLSTNFNQPLNSWDVSSVTDMSHMLQRMDSFNQPLDSWDVSHVTTLNGMFDNSYAFNQPLDSWDVSSATDMSQMFEQALSFNQPLGSWDVSHVVSLTRMFYYAISFNQPLNSWDVSSVIDLYQTFYATSSFDQPLDNWDVSHVTSMGWTFAGASVFNQPLVTWDVSSATTMSYMFDGAISFNQPLNSWDVSHVTTMDSMFDHGYVFNQPLDAWDVSHVTDMSYMFSQAAAFNQSLASWDVSSVATMTKMFNDGGAPLFGTTSGLDTSNYDATLTGWSSQALHNSITFDAGTSAYCNAEVNRALIVSTHTWTINDAGKDCTGTYAPDEFVTTWKTDNPGVSASDQITIPTTGSGYNYNVDWGDSSTSSGQTGDATHTYSAPGTYTVKITGTFPRIYMGFSGNDQQKILTVEHWGSNPWTSMASAFYGAANLTISATDTPNLSGVTDMSYMFYDSSSLNSNINNWDVSHVTNMYSLFAYTDVFDQPLDNWDVSHVTDMSSMFTLASAFDQDLSSWDVSHVTNMHILFYGAAAFNQPLNSWVVSSVTDMNGMFAGAALFNQPLDSWDVSHVTDMHYLFYGADVFNQPLDSWDVSQVTDMGGMFLYAIAFNQPVNSWVVSSVTDMNGMFAGAALFNQPLDSWDVSQVTDMGGMFHSASSFNRNINSWDTSGITIIQGMFQEASTFNQPLNSWDVSHVTDMRFVFQQATNFNQPLGNWDVSQVTVMFNTFKDATSFNQPLNSWNTSSTTYMAGMFQGASAFNQPLDNWDVSHVDYMYLMFSGATSFDQSLGSWNISNTRFMWSMFANGAGLSTANYDATLSGWDLLSLQNNVTFDAGTSTYCASASDRADIISTLGWTINDSGENCPYAPNEFVTTWDTTLGSAPNDYITIPTDLYDTYNYNVNWGDSTSSTGQTGDATHFYASPGVYTVRITGLFPHLVSNTSSSTVDKLLTVEQWGENHWTSMAYTFTNAHNLTIPATDVPDLSGVTDMSHMFWWATSFNESIDSWNVGNVTNMSHIFERAVTFDKPLDNWDVSNVTDMNGMFTEAYAFNQPLGNWNVGNVTTMNAMFGFASEFNQPLNSWDVSNVTDMNGLFILDLAFDQPLDSWDTHNVTSMNSTFGLGTFNQPLNSWDVSNVTDMSHMFAAASLFNQSLASWDVSNVTTMNAMFAAASVFNQSLGTWNVSNVTDMQYMFGDHDASGQGPGTSGLSTANYDATLTGWRALSLQNNVTFDAGTSTYCDAASDRADIISTFGWTINDSGENCPSNQTDFSLTKTLSTLGVIHSGDSVTYHVKITNEGPEDSEFAGALYDILPVEFSYTSSTNNSQVSCSQSLADDINPYFANHYHGHYVLGCTPAVTGIVLLTGQSMEFDITGTANANFTAGSTVNRAVYADFTYETAASATIENAATTDVDIFSLPLNNISNTLYTASATPVVTPPTKTPTKPSAGGPTTQPETTQEIPAIVAPLEKLLTGDSAATPLGQQKLWIPAFIRNLSPVEAFVLPLLLLIILLILAALYTRQAYREYKQKQIILALVKRYQATKTASTNYISIASHYLRTPAAIMSGAVELLGSLHKIPDWSVANLQVKLKSFGQAISGLEVSLPDVAGTNAPLAVTLPSARILRPKQVWLPLLGVAGGLVVSDIVFTLAGVVRVPIVYMGLQLLCFALAAGLLVLSYRFKQVQISLRNTANQLVAAEQQLLAQMQAFIGQASTSLSDQYESLRIASQDYGSVPEAKTFYNGLRLLGGVAASMMRIGRFTSPDAPTVVSSAKDSYDRLAVHLQTIANEHQVSLQTSIDPTLRLHASTEEIDQILFSTIDNAIKFSQPGAQVAVTAHIKGKHAVVSIGDSGTGFTAEKLQHLFEPFGRGTSTETYDHQGLGLNLYTNKIIIEKLGGTIAVLNTHPHGAKIHITLPLEQQSSAATPLIIQPQLSTVGSF